MVSTRALVGALALVVVGGLVLSTVGVLPNPLDEDRATVTVTPGADGERATVDAEVASTPAERYTGLSEHESLERGEGMLFVYDEEDERTFVMREMAFDIDIVFVGADGRITGIEHARAPEPGEDGEQLQHTGTAQWVLEVPRGYANETGMAVGDAVEIPADAGSRNRTEIAVVADADEPRAQVDADVADTSAERYTGLSDHDSLASGEGMLFVHDGEDDRTYVMREMEFPIDIVFVGADGRITGIEHARAPGPDEDGEDLEYSGTAKWVLEVPRGYANESGIAVGDEVDIEYH